MFRLENLYQAVVGDDHPVLVEPSVVEELVKQHLHIMGSRISKSKLASAG